MKPIGSALFFVLGSCLLSAWQPDNPHSVVFQQNAQANRGRVEQLLRAAPSGTDLTHYVVPAMSDVMRLGDVYPEDGEWNESVGVVLAQDEYEPASFQLFSLRDRQHVTFVVPDLRSGEGAVLSADKLDLRVVKIWYQAGNRWHSYFQDIGLRLTPELLLKDEGLIRVDTVKQANHARIRKEQGDRYQWISAPIELDPAAYYHRGRFDPFQPGFADADTLQPVALEANQFKQFFLTVHAEKEQPPGLYTGVIEVSEDGRKIYTIPVAVRVLPFVLPAPLSWRDLERPFVASIMSGFELDRLRSFYNPDMSVDFLRGMLLNAKRHNLMYPRVDQLNGEEGITLLQELGFPTKPYIAHPYRFLPHFTHTHRMSFDQMMTAKSAAEKARDYYQEKLGHSDILLKHGDENGPGFVVATREFYPYFEQHGILIGNAGHSSQFYKGGYAYGWHMMGGYPDVTYRIKRWKDLDVYLSFYAGQHTGSENPQFVRRQHGLLSYLQGHNMTYNYRFAWGPWNDRSNTPYRPMVVAYLNHGGVVDTLQWEGFREAIDDIRYLTQLQLLVREAIASGDIRRLYEARKAKQYLALLDQHEADLNTMRMDVIEYILTLMELDSSH
jgi:hypothetical protein